MSCVIPNKQSKEEIALKDQPSQVLKFLFLGGKAHARDRTLLRRLNICHVVNCTPPKSVDSSCGLPNYFKKDKTDMNISYLRIPIFDNKGEDILSYLDKAVDFINHGKHYGNVLVHCFRGVSRSATFVMAYLMREMEMTLEEALSHVESCRKEVQPNPSFLSQLRKYEDQLREGRKRTDEISSSDQLFPGVMAGPSLPMPAPLPASDENQKDPKSEMSDSNASSDIEREHPQKKRRTES